MRGGEGGARWEVRESDLGKEVSGGSSNGRWENELLVQDAFVHNVHVAVIERGLQQHQPYVNS